MSSKCVSFSSHMTHFLHFIQPPFLLSHIYNNSANVQINYSAPLYIFWLQRYKDAHTSLLRLKGSPAPENLFQGQKKSTL